MSKFRVACSLLASLSFVLSVAFSTQPGDEEKAIRTVVEGYLRARDWKERLPFVHQPAEQEGRMREKYEGKAFELQNPAVQRIEQLDKLPGSHLVKATWTEKGKTQGFAGYYVVRKNADGVKIDWPGSVGYNPVNLKALLAKKPKDAHVLRVIAAIDSKYIDDYAAARDTHYCFLLKEDNPLQTVYAYIPRTSPDGQRLHEQLKQRKEARDRVILEIRFTGPDGQEVKSARTVAIGKLVSDTWVAP